MSPQKGIALITGSAQGIGRGIAIRLARDGFDIALNDLPTKREQLAAVAIEVEELGRKACIVIADVTIEEEVKNMIADTVKGLSRLDVMVANAGIPAANTVLATTVEDWERTFAVNARGVFLCYKHAAGQMISQGHGGRIIGASSIAGKIGFPSAAAYCASKFAVRGLTQTAALELGKYNITVNAYAPGVIQTQMRNVSLTDEDSTNYLVQLMGNRPIKHNGQPEDIASIVSYLASKEAHFITGQCVSAQCYPPHRRFKACQDVKLALIFIHNLGTARSILTMSQPKGVALITGSAQGIGRAIAIRLARDGFDIALNDIPAKTAVLEDLAAELQRGGESYGTYHPRTCIVACDISKEDEVKRMIDTAVDVLGSLDVMVANAGISAITDILNETLESWERVMKINATSAFLCYKYAAVQMVRQGPGGRIIGASSMVGIRGKRLSPIQVWRLNYVYYEAEPNLLSYSASKFAVRALTQAASMQLGRYGITVNSYAPGIIETPMVVASRDVIAKRGEVDYFQQKIDLSGVGYIGQPEDIANTVAYLASKEAHFITGKLPISQVLYANSPVVPCVSGQCHRQATYNCAVPKKPTRDRI
ncbi:NAD(P)-binding protein [Suillus paluster]|uniref:NAD(P)-binding protein n=1 Tax=Suillus paluster TaxID=48578 RepID=UPI001B87DE8E|nr:NAD(P)-binding protein [Suillus paluster]KAG1732886.1 NAD(P)-binding protein [Suillus paluster]